MLESTRVIASSQPGVIGCVPCAKVGSAHVGDVSVRRPAKSAGPTAQLIAWCYNRVGREQEGKTLRGADPVVSPRATDSNFATTNLFSLTARSGALLATPAWQQGQDAPGSIAFSRYIPTPIHASALTSELSAAPGVGAAALGRDFRCPSAKPFSARCGSSKTSAIIARSTGRARSRTTWTSSATTRR